MAIDKTSNTRIMRTPIGNLQQGILADVNPLEAPPGSATPVGTMNVVWVNGYLQPRPGFLTIQDLPVSDRVHKLLTHQDRLGNTWLCAVTLHLATGVGTLRQLIAGVWTTISTITSGQLSATVPITNCNFAGVTYFTTGLGDVWVFDPQAYLSGTPLQKLNALQSNVPFQIPTAVQIIVSGDPRLIIANYTTPGPQPTPYGVDWSNFSDTLTWGGAIANQGGDSGGTVLPKNSDPITGLYVNSSVLTVFRAREVYLGVEVGSPAVYKIACFDQGPGCVAHATIQPYRDGAIVWLGDDNVYIGAPGQQPQPLGDHIRLRIRQVANLGLLPQSKALLDYDNQLYTLFLPDVSTGLNTRMFTCNLRNGGWWESQIADTSLVVTDAIAYRLNPWQTQNIVGTADGRVLQFILGYQQDDATSFPCSWQSAIFSAKSFFGMDHEVASLQTLRVITGPPFNSGSKVNFTLNHGDNLDRMVTTAFANPQILDGMSELFAIERPASNSLFQVVASSATAAQFPPIAQLELGAIAQGALR